MRTSSLAARYREQLTGLNMSRLTTLQQALISKFGEDVDLKLEHDELTLTVSAEQWKVMALDLRDSHEFGFESCVDLCGVDYLTYGQAKEGDHFEVKGFPNRFAVVMHLLSLKNNWRLRVRTFVPNPDLPVISSLVDVWPSVNWFEREAYDLFGIVFEGHPDLRRILTDYGFIGHPFRKDFPVYGNVEMRFDPEQGRVIYQPVTIEPREVVARVIREEGYGVGR